MPIVPGAQVHGGLYKAASQEAQRAKAAPLNHPARWGHLAVELRRRYIGPDGPHRANPSILKPLGTRPRRGRLKTGFVRWLTPYRVRSTFRRIEGQSSPAIARRITFGGRAAVGACRPSGLRLTQHLSPLSDEPTVPGFRAKAVLCLQPPTHRGRDRVLQCRRAGDGDAVEATPAAAIGGYQGDDGSVPGQGPTSLRPGPSWSRRDFTRIDSMARSRRAGQHHRSERQRGRARQTSHLGHASRTRLRTRYVPWPRRTSSPSNSNTSFTRLPRWLR